MWVTGMGRVGESGSQRVERVGVRSILRKSRQEESQESGSQSRVKRESGQSRESGSRVESRGQV